METDLATPATNSTASTASTMPEDAVDPTGSARASAGSSLAGPATSNSRACCLSPPAQCRQRHRMMPVGHMPLLCHCDDQTAKSDTSNATAPESEALLCCGRLARPKSCRCGSTGTAMAALPTRACIPLSAYRPRLRGLTRKVSVLTPGCRTSVPTCTGSRLASSPAQPASWYQMSCSHGRMQDLPVGRCVPACPKYCPRTAAPFSNDGNTAVWAMSWAGDPYVVASAHTCIPTRFRLVGSDTSMLPCIHSMRVMSEHDATRHPPARSNPLSCSTVCQKQQA